MKENITIQEAYVAMYLYLEKLYKMTDSDDLAGFLGGMSLLEDGKPADPAAWHDWLEAVEGAKKGAEISLKLIK